MFVAESKFRSHRHEYVPLIKAQDADGLMNAITDAHVEAKVRVAFRGVDCNAV